jgi:hypothetical protein
MQIMITAYEKLGMNDLATDAQRVYAATWGGQQPTQQAAQASPAPGGQQPTQPSPQAATTPPTEPEPDTRASAN